VINNNCPIKWRQVAKEVGGNYSVRHQRIALLAEPPFINVDFIIDEREREEGSKKNKCQQRRNVWPSAMESPKTTEESAYMSVVVNGDCIATLGISVIAT